MALRAIIKQIILHIYFFARRLALLPLSVKTHPCIVANKPRILVIRLDRIGDLALTTPLFKILKQHFPQAHITALARQATKDILEGNPFVDRIAIHQSFVDSIKMLREQFDIVIDPYMNYDLLPALLARFMKSPCTIGFDIQSRGMLFNSPVPHSQEHKHFTAHFADLLAPLQISVGPADLIPAIFVNDDESAALNLPAKDIPIISLHPGGFYASQRWPAPSFAQLITLCSQKYPSMRYVLLGTETDVIESIKNLLPKEISTHIVETKAKSLRDTIRVIKRSTLFIGNNSGLLHIAAALKVPTVSTMGPTIPWLWHPCGQLEKNIVVKSPTNCISCEKGYGDGHTCLNSISVEKMFVAVQKALV